MIPRTILVVAEPFGAHLSAELVGEAIGRGLRAGDPSLDVDLCLLDWPVPSGSGQAEPRANLNAHLNALNFDARMHRARAVVIAAARLDRETLLERGAIFEIATRARQGGVPAHAIAEHDELDPFEARIVDLQVVLTADGERGLVTAGRRLCRSLD